LGDGDEIPEVLQLHCHIQFNMSFAIIILYLVFLGDDINSCFGNIDARVSCGGVSRHFGGPS
jgi:hypothetical protein